jgi:hypothetical protein
MVTQKLTFAGSSPTNLERRFLWCLADFYAEPLNGRGRRGRAADADLKMEG